MMKVVLLYGLLVSAIAGLVYGVPSIKANLEKKHRQAIALILSIGFVVVMLIYFLEIRG